MKKLTILLSIFVSITAVYAQQNTVRHSDRDITMMIPTNWSVQDSALAYKVLIGPVDSEINPNVTIASENYSDTISSYIDLTVKQLQEVFANYNIIEKGTFTIDSGLSCSFFSYTGTMMNVNVWQKIFVIQNRSREAVLVICCTSSVNRNSHYEPIFNQMIRSLIWR